MSAPKPAEQWLTVPFTAGAEKRLRPELVPSGKLLDLQNYSFNKDGTLRRRDALVALSGTTGLDTSSPEMSTLDGELLTVDTEGALWSYSQDATTPLQNKGAVPIFSLRKDQVRRSTGQQVYLDSAYASGLTAFVWQDLTNVGIYCSVYSERSGGVLVNNLQLSSSGTASFPRVCVTNGFFVFFWADNANLNAASLSVGGTALTVSATTVATDFRTGSGICLDASGTTSGALAVFNATSGTAVRCILLNGATLAAVSGGTEQTLDSGGAPASLAVVPITATTWWVVAGQNIASCRNMVATYTAGVSVAVTSGPNTQATSATPASVTGANVGGNVLQVFCAPTFGTFVQWTKFQLSSTAVASSVSSAWFAAGTATGSAPIVGGAAGKAFSVFGVAYVPIYVTSSLQSQMLVIDGSANVVARALYGNYGAAPVNAGMLPSCPSTTNSAIISVPAFEKGTLSFSSGTATTQQGVSRIQLVVGRGSSTADLKTTPLWHAQGAKCMYFSGASPVMYDGVQVSEAGFHYFPEGITVTDHTSGTGPGAGTYTYFGVFEWVDGRGQRHQSAPSPGLVKVIANGNQYDVRVCSLLLGTRPAGSYVAVYRTQNAGVTALRLGSIANSTSAAFVTFADTFTDASIAGNEPLYTQPLQSPTVLPNYNPGALQAVAPWQGRIVASLAEDRYAFTISQQEVVGVGLQWDSQSGDGLFFRIPRSYGEITAIGIEDEKIVLFTPTRKLWLAGTPPDDTGENSGLSNISALPTDVGCVDQRSVVAIPEVQGPTGSVAGGLGFQSKHGYYLLTRALTDSYIGAPVESDVTGHVISSAVVLEDKPQLRLVRSDAGDELVYDYLWGQWSKFTGGLTRSAGCVWNGLWTVADASNTQIAQESSGNYLDLGSTVIVGTLQTAWIELNKVAGFQRVWWAVLLGSGGGSTGNGSSNAVTSVDFDYGLAGVAPGAYNFTVTGTAGFVLAAGMPIELRHEMRHQECQAVAFKIVDTPIAGVTNGGTNWTALKLLVGPKEGVPRLPPAQSL